MKFYLTILSCFAAALIPFMSTGQSKAVVESEFFIPSAFNGSKLVEVPMSKVEKTFYEDFPGETKYFQLKDKPSEKLLLRFITDPSRKVHSIKTCYKACGHEITEKENLSLKINELSDQPLQWSQFGFLENGQKFIVRQTILSLHSGKNYSDIASWYWLTTFSGGDEGPWVAVTWKLPE